MPFVFGGGDNFQLILLNTFEHKLTSNLAGNHRLSNGIIYWDYECLINYAVEFHRGFLNNNLNSKSSKVLETLFLGSNNLREVVLSRKETFPEVHSALSSLNKKEILALSWQDQLVLAEVLCEDIATAVDAKETLDNHTLEVINLFPPEICLLAMRHKVGLSRIINANLDENSFLKPMFDRVNKLVD